MNLIETHSHLCDPSFDADRNEAVARARQSGIAAIIEIADSPKTWDEARTFSESSALSQEAGIQPHFIYWSCGFHPHYAEDFSKGVFDTMKRVASSKSCVAIGEIGMDSVKSRTSKESQVFLFEKMVALAIELEKPVVIHCREAHADVLRVLKSFFKGRNPSHSEPGVIHCFSGDIKFAEECLDLGFCIGVDGPVTYPGAKDLREVLLKVPIEKILLETDSPYLPPQNFRGKRNEPAYLVYIAEKVGEIFKRSVEDISSITTQNARRLFTLP